MRASLTQLQKILRNEISHKYANKAVIGGLPKLLVFWEPNARRDELEPAFIERAAERLRAYPDLPEAERPAAIETLLAMIHQADASAPAKSEPARPASQPPARPPSRPAANPPGERPRGDNRPASQARPAEPSAARPPRPETNPQEQRPPRPPQRPAERGPEQAARPARQPQPPAPMAEASQLPAAQAARPVPPPPTGQSEPAAPARAPEQASVSASAPEPAAAPEKPARPPRPPQPAAPKTPPPAPRKKGPKDNAAQQQQQRKRADIPYLHEEPVDPHPRRPANLPPVKSLKPSDPGAGLDAPLTVLRGIGAERLKDLQNLGLNSLRDLLYYFPRRYDNYATLKTIHRLEYGEECSIIGEITHVETRRLRTGASQMLRLTLSDSTGALDLTFFNGTPWLARSLSAGRMVVVSGRVDQYLGRLTMTNPDWEYLDQELLNTGRIVPVYRLTQGVGQHTLRKLSAQIVDYWARKQPDALPAEILASAGLMAYGEALAQLHFPDSLEKLAAAQHRLAFDELLLLQLGVLRQRRDWQSAAAEPLAVADEVYQARLTALPFSLTGAQQRALADIRADLARPTPMNRLLQGDVGSGKTAVAAVAAGIAVAAGSQAAIMAPTSILAEQHFRTLTRLLGYPEGAIRLLQGATPAAEKDEIYAGLQSGAIQVVIGTHALIESPVTFAKLGLVVVDEQHRFGVAQRAALRGKGANPHLLVMTATPIPRTLALTVYGDLDLTLLNELPPGRQPIQTHLLHANERERGYAFIRRQVQQGRQAFIIFPLVEESEKIEAKAAVAEHARLQRDVFSEFKLGLLHGRLKPAEKDDVMQRFNAGELNILVATSVVEVGVDVPNATIIAIEGANRFGLAQLHQFRGRVGRGEHASHCLLISEAPNLRADERLIAMEHSQDGFVLAEKDLELRGPGDFLGTRQSGLANLSLARLGDVATIEKARRAAQRLFERDPDLAAPEHQTLAANLERFWTPGAGDVS